MALEAVVFQQDPFNYGCKDQPQFRNPDGFMSNTNNCESQNAILDDEKINRPVVVEAPRGRPKRRRIRSIKNKEEVENQRMTHIAVERNRRKQMNDYLNVLRAIMPSSYSQRGDQASIIGGAINYVKELEQLLQTLEAQKRVLNQQSAADTTTNSLFSDFFTFPQYSTWSNSNHGNPIIIKAEKRFVNVADVEVTMAEKHANIKILSERQPKRLMKIVGGLHSHGLTILHLNVTTVDNTILYCVSVKVEDHCKLNSVNEIAAAVYEMVGGVRS